MTNRKQHSLKVLAELNNALSLLEEKFDVSAAPSSSVQGSTELEIKEAEGLLGRCANELNENAKPKLRIIHHLACSGGTLISKCLSALPNVYLLSEVHPHTSLALDVNKPRYSPTDISSLAKYANIPFANELADKIFKQSIIAAYEHVESLGGTLVLRDHTHADFHTSDEIPQRSTVVTLLEEHFNIQSILTVRDPIDSYSSLVKNGWVHFEPKSFNEYCRRLLLLLEQFSAEQIFSYELFSSEPQAQVSAICQKLELPFDEAFESIFSLFNVTGDSGRKSDAISERERIAPQAIIEESEKSSFYQKFKEKYHITI
ncbi:hypothetical protein ACZ81_17175 [Alteromonas macleodii]|uniref:sulfotransferase n=1 Tax=Alteromonas macleodii TaxID=28108 RepID=UPI0007780F54|nr:sulfotransferase [Alteromonas macleodii]AMN13159.1 hypothetical protein ACZ81_17175 [Alteromonas macleodii]MBL3811653.1 sulfotransferase [Alteromonas macleodii]MBL3885191.1 sulfotransferase [Alteromonas macleodii]